jgi:hypothetical protein
MSRIALCLALSLFAASAAGCVAVAAGAAAAGTVEYVRNASAREVSADVPTTWSAVFESLREQGYPVDPTLTRTGAGSFDIEDAKVAVQPTKNGRTRVTVRVGTFDTQAHRDRARRILDGVQARLGS